MPATYRFASLRSVGVGNRALIRTSPSQSGSRSRSASMAFRVLASTGSRSSTTISPSSVWVQAPTTRPSAQTVGPALPLRSNSSDAWSPRYHRALLPAHDRRVEPREQRDPRVGLAHRLEVLGQHVAGALVQLDLHRAQSIEGRGRELRRPPGPPADVRAGRGPERSQPPTQQVGAGLRVIQLRQRRAEPGLGRRPPILARGPRAERARPDDPTLGREQEQHPGREAHRPGPRLALAEAELAAELGNIVRELARGGLPSARRAHRASWTPPVVPTARLGPPRRSPAPPASRSDGGARAARGPSRTPRPSPRPGPAGRRTACGASRASGRVIGARRARPRGRRERTPRPWPTTRGTRSRDRSSAIRPSRRRHHPRSAPVERARVAARDAHVAPRPRCASRHANLHAGRDTATTTSGPIAMHRAPDVALVSPSILRPCRRSFGRPSGRRGARPAPASRPARGRGARGSCSRTRDARSAGCGRRPRRRATRSSARAR